MHGEGCDDHPADAPCDAAAPTAAAADAGARSDPADAARGADPTGNADAGDADASGPGLGARLGAYRGIYIAVAAFALLYVFTVTAVERVLGVVFERRVAEALEIHDFQEPVAWQIQNRLDASVRRSLWVRWGGVRVDVLVIGRDGSTLVYAGGPPQPRPPGRDLMANLREAERLLPATVQVQVSVPHNTVLSNAILLAYAAVLIQGLYLYNRALGRRERAELEAALGARDLVAARARAIEAELASVRDRLSSVEPVEREHALEIAQLERERERLRAQLDAVAAREAQLRGSAADSLDLDEERRTLEELLDEASRDLQQKDQAIRELEQRLDRAARRNKSARRARSRESEWLARRLRTLYKNLEIDARAIDDLLELGDEALRLKAEENLKRLDAESDNVAVRRKVGGLPSQLSIYELSFAGKGRIYYRRGTQRRYRVLLVGGKASQRADLEYLSRLEA